MCGSGHKENEHGLYPPLPEEISELARRLTEGDLPDDIYSVIIETQCGATDDSQPVEQYDGTLGVTNAFVNTHQGPVGQLQWNDDLALVFTNPGNVSGVRWCSGTLIAEDLFLTAGHCLDSFSRVPGQWQLPFTNGTNTVISPDEIAANMHVNFNFQVDPNGNLRTEQRFAIGQLTEHRIGQLDFAILRLIGSPAQAFGTTDLGQADAALQDPICIIGHPAGQPKRLEAGSVSGLVGNEIRYNDIDTLGGNSGSGILSSPIGRIVGVHTNGGCVPTGGFNFGVRISNLLGVSPTLQSLTTINVDDEAKWITALYADLLSRTPDQAGLDGWTAARAGGSSLRYIVNGFLRSTEYCTNIVSLIYAQLLDRQPDQQGTQWIDQLEHGVPRQEILIGFLNSDEYRGNNQIPDRFVESLYNRLLGRPSDLIGKQGWINALSTGTSTVDVIRGFLTSQEYCIQRITELYTALLGRAPDPAGLAVWINFMTSGEALQEVQYRFLASPEYRARSVARF